MTISKKDRKDYEHGRRDSKQDVVTKVMTHITGNHPKSSAYYQARRGKPLDKSKGRRK